MKLETYIQNLFPDQSYTLTKTNKGLTNDNYLLEVEQDRFMVRVARHDSQHIVCAEDESKALACIQGHELDVEEYFFDPQVGIRITRYLSDAYDYQDCPYPDKIEQTAKLMRRFHAIKQCIDKPFDPFSRLAQYRSRIQRPIYDFIDEQAVIQKAQAIYQPTILCHNDWVSGNILFHQHRVYLIDYEYAADNDPLFDVMSFITENQIQHPEFRERFYQTYFEGTSIPYDKLRIWEDFHNLLWGNWAMMMYESRQEKIYQDIAYDKYMAYTHKQK